MAHACPNAMMGNIEEAGNNATKGNIEGRRARTGCRHEKTRGRSPPLGCGLSH